MSVVFPVYLSGNPTVQLRRVQDNAVLYCIGDLNVDDTEEQIRLMFGHLGGVPDTTVSPSRMTCASKTQHLLPNFLKINPGDGGVNWWCANVNSNSDDKSHPHLDVRPCQYHVGA